MLCKMAELNLISFFWSKIRVEWISGIVNEVSSLTILLSFLILIMAFLGEGKKVICREEKGVELSVDCLVI